MYKSHLVKALCVISASALCLCGFAGCASGSVPGAVAATVDGSKIYENDVTEYIEALRSQYNMTDDESWAAGLASSGSTVAEFREEVIDSFVTRELINTHAKDRDVSVESSEIDEYVNQTKSNYETEEKWQSALEQVGMTEDEYRKEIERQLKSKYLEESFADEVKDPSKKEQLEQAQTYASSYDGAKKSSHILFKADDEKTAKKVLKKLNDGDIKFADAAKQYSQDSGSAEDGGNVGWDKMTSLVDEYQDALDKLNKGEMSELVTSSFGIHIILCTDEYEAPKTYNFDGEEEVKITSLDQIPSDWLDSIKDALKSDAQSEAYDKWLSDLRKSADIEIKDMPSGLPYDVDMSKYQTDDADDSSDDTKESSDDKEESSSKSEDEKNDEAA